MISKNLGSDYLFGNIGKGFALEPLPERTISLTRTVSHESPEVKLGALKFYEFGTDAGDVSASGLNFEL